MRTTLSLDDDVFREVKAYAESRDVAIGKAVSELVRRGLHAPYRPARQRLSRRRASAWLAACSTEDVEKLQDELE